MIEAFPFLKTEVFSNSLWDYGVSAGIFLAAFIAVSILRHFLWRRLQAWVKKTSTRLDDLAVELLDRLVFPVLYVLAFYFAVSHLDLHKSVDYILKSAAVILMVVQSSRLFLTFLVYFFEEYWKKRAEGQESGVPTGLLTVARISVWGLAFVFALDNMGFNISAVIAGLGIGGIAIALASQTILGDLFNYFVIFFDKPFRQGDFVIFEDYMGVIEHIGIKSTRIRALGGEQIVVSNSTLTGTKIRNYKRMAERRIVFQLGIVYQTSVEKVKKIPQLVKEIIEQLSNARFDRAHFSSFGASSLNFEVVYYVLVADYNRYMDIQEKINLAVMEAFQKESIEFAYPTQTVYEHRLSYTINETEK